MTPTNPAQWHAPAAPAPGDPRHSVAWAAATPKPSTGAAWWWAAAVGTAIVGLIGLASPKYALRAALVLGVALAAVLVVYTVAELLRRIPSDARSGFRPNARPPSPPPLPFDVQQLQAASPDAPITYAAAKAVTDIATERLWANHRLNLYEPEHHDAIRRRVSPALWSVFSSTQHAVAAPSHRDLDRLLDELEQM